MKEDSDYKKFLIVVGLFVINNTLYFNINLIKYDDKYDKI